MLENTLYRLRTEKKLCLGFFGGSITDGTGSSDFEKNSYRAIVTESFRQAYPDAEITSVNAAIGGTGTGYGMFRCEKDLLVYKPDLIFVEFSGNDWGDSYGNVLPRAEAIFRKIRRGLPTADAVAVFSRYDDIAAEVEQGIEFESRSATVTAAHHYGFPTVDPGAALHAHILRNGGVFRDFIPDTVHPSDAGHRVMGDCISNLLKKWLDAAEAEGVASDLTSERLPSPLCADVIENACMIAVSELEGLKLDGFTLEEKVKENGKTSRYLEALRPGDSFSFTLRGRCLGFCWGDANINGDVTVQIDGGEPILVRSWDHSVRSFNRMENAIVTISLDPEVPHSVTVTAEKFEPTETSPDEAVRIEYIFVG